MDDPELALALLEIVAVLLPLGLLALGMVPRLMDFDGPEILGLNRTIAFGATAGLSLLFLAGSGLMLSIFLYGEADSTMVESGLILLIGVFLFFGVIGSGVAIAFEVEKRPLDRETEEREGM